MALSEKEQADLKRLVRVAQALCFCMMASIFTFPLVFISAGSAPFRDFPQLPDWAVWSVAGWALFSLLLAGRMQQFIMLRGGLQKRNAGAATRIWFSSVVVSMALRELSAAMGLLLALLTQKLAWCFGFGILAIIAIGRNWPRYGRHG